MNLFACVTTLATPLQHLNLDLFKLTQFSLASTFPVEHIGYIAINTAVDACHPRLGVLIQPLSFLLFETNYKISFHLILFLESSLE